MTFRAEVDDGDVRRLKRETAQAAERSVAVSAPGAAGGLALHTRAVVPRRTGRLASSITVRPVPDGAEVRMGDGIPYAGWIEYGGTRGRPYVAKGRYLGSGMTAADALFGRLTDAAMTAFARGV